MKTPTSIVCHDYYPLWPHLHVDFGDESADFSPQALDKALAKGNGSVVPLQVIRGGETRILYLERYWLTETP